MAFALLVLLGTALGLCIRQIRLLRACGYLLAARRLYRRCAWLLGGGTYAAMLVQELLLLAAGKLTWRSGLPLHLCSLMGLLSLPMLLSRKPLLFQLSLYLGIPGGLLALTFPAVAETPWPWLTELAFAAMHCGVILTPLLPMCLGDRPTPMGAWWAFGALVLMACTALLANALTGGNYFFLNGSPIAWMNGWGLTAWRVMLACVSMLVLLGEGVLVRLCQSKPGWS